MDDLLFPSSYVRLISAIREGGWPYFVLKEKVDAYGDRFDNGLKIVVPLDHTSPARFVFHHLTMARFLQSSDATTSADRPEDTSVPSASEPGLVPAAPDFSRILFFGTGGERRGTEVSRYAFDYRDSESEPSVICCQNGFWRRVAPDVDAFLDLFRLAPNRFQESDVGYFEMEEARIARTVEALARM